MFSNNTELEVRDKLTILMLIHELEVPLTNEQITEIVLDSNLINYISLQHYITELCELSMVETIPQDNKEHYLLTENGRVALDFFKVRIPSYIQDKVNLVVKDFKLKLPVETAIHADYKKISDDNYEVTISITENKAPMMTLNLNVMSEKHASLICNKWQNQASYLYGDILNVLTQESK